MYSLSRQPSTGELEAPAPPLHRQQQQYRDDVGIQPAVGLEDNFDANARSLAAKDSLALERSYPRDDVLMDPVKYRRQQRRKRLVYGTLCLLVLAAVAVSVFLTLSRDTDEAIDFVERDVVITSPPTAAVITSSPTAVERDDGITSAPTTAAPTPTPAPTTPSPTSSLYFSFQYQVLAPLVANPSLLLDSTTPQGKAFLTILNETDPFQIQQRFALMVIWYATGGMEWDFNYGWRDYANGIEHSKREECYWAGVSLCRNQGNGTLAIAGFRLGKCPIFAYLFVVTPAHLTETFDFNRRKQFSGGMARRGLPIGSDGKYGPG